MNFNDEKSPHEVSTHEVSKLSPIDTLRNTIHKVIILDAKSGKIAQHTLPEVCKGVLGAEFTPQEAMTLLDNAKKLVNEDKLDEQNLFKLGAFIAHAYSSPQYSESNIGKVSQEILNEPTQHLISDKTKNETAETENVRRLNRIFAGTLLQIPNTNERELQAVLELYKKGLIKLNTSDLEFTSLILHAHTLHSEEILTDALDFVNGQIKLNPTDKSDLHFDTKILVMVQMGKYAEAMRFAAKQADINLKHRLAQNVLWNRARYDTDLSDTLHSVLDYADKTYTAEQSSNKDDEILNFIHGVRHRVDYPKQLEFVRKAICALSAKSLSSIADLFPDKNSFANAVTQTDLISNLDFIVQSSVVNYIKNYDGAVLNFLAECLVKGIISADQTQKLQDIMKIFNITDEQLEAKKNKLKTRELSRNAVSHPIQVVEFASIISTYLLDKKQIVSFSDYGQVAEYLTQMAREKDSEGNLKWVHNQRYLDIVNILLQLNDGENKISRQWSG